MKQQLETLLKERVDQFVSDDGHISDEKLARKLQSLRQREAEIVQVKAAAHVISEQKHNQETSLDYMVHFHFFLRQNELFYDEEGIEYRTGRFVNGTLVEDIEKRQKTETLTPECELDLTVPGERASYTYNHLKAVQYAERWWNEFNPAYKKFQDDCTNFISQCLHAGGIPMWGAPNKSKGWWIGKNSWSYSWTTANSLMLILTKGQGIRTKQVRSPQELQLGDIICYDFQGDGRFDHNTIVTGKDQNGMPLVNAHTTNSRRRYWAYEDSTAYTPNIRYKYYTILDGN
ncbi:hypothetical protein ELQ35_18240 [Peribacillus cavernae]|uniref:Putative amidase domain-containing protein n=1 Tax=Peribacillus cavernae TaxID=1674310 RepID=A0A433HEB2_9BACI|nr:amidase domain-containing protein [Peribacillus cavernae]MDQ0219871.1 hypothetical protein [Peribacillus cavernae]RUQ26641.1 hypothetical protein ELQ35_18240 [Peribacillus cavernae]